MRPSESTLKYFKTIPSSHFTFDIPNAHHESHLNNFKDLYTEDNEKFWVKLKDISQNILTMDNKKCSRYVFLSGCAGSGKTHIVVGLYRAMVEKIGYAHGGGALFIPFTNMAADIIAGFSEKIPIRDALAEYTKNKWIFLDDFTASERVFKQDSLEYQLFRDIVLNRWETGYTLITSSNLADTILIKKLDEIFGDYLVSRLSDSTIIEFPFEDMRRQGFGGHNK